MSRENVEVIRRLYEAIARRDSELVLDLYDPDVEWDMSGYPYGEMLDTRSRGHAGLRTFWRELYEAWEGYEHEVHELVDAGDHVISIVTDRARGRASGAEVEISAYGVWTIRDGRIVRAVWFRTRQEAFDAAGLSDEAGAGAPDEQRFRAVMGHFATGVTVVTGSGPNGAVGMTTNAFCSLSLRPQLVLVCFDNTSRTLPIVRETGRFGVSVLRTGHEGLSGQFASKLPAEEKFDLVTHTEQHGVPILDDALAWVACDLRELLPGGDHTIGIGEALAMDHADGEPLVWYRGRYGTVAAGGE